jgi:hypothetical protein
MSNISIQLIDSWAREHELKEQHETRFYNPAQVSNPGLCRVDFMFC